MARATMKKAVAKAERKAEVRRKGDARRKSKADEDNALIARFISATANLVLWKKPIEEEVIGTRIRTKAGSGYAIEFQNGQYQTNKQEDIIWMIERPDLKALGVPNTFRSDYHPLPMPGDWWEAHEFFRKNTKEVLSPTKKSQLREEEKKKIIEPLAETMVKEMESSEPETATRVGTET